MTAAFTKQKFKIPTIFHKIDQTGNCWIQVDFDIDISVIFAFQNSGCRIFAGMLNSRRNLRAWQHQTVHGLSGGPFFTTDGDDYDTRMFKYG